jgi:hypothetical protein
MNREAWLEAAINALRPMLEENGSPVPADVRVSCGFPGGKSVHKVIGQCWASKANDGVSQVFVSPLLHDGVEILAVLIHELIHAWNDCKDGHKGAFRRAALAIGLEGKMTATTAGEALTGRLGELAAELGDYPHKKMTLADLGIKKQTTRMIKVECPACGYVVRTTAKWLEIGTPTCVCGESMEAAA